MGWGANCARRFVFLTLGTAILAPLLIVLSGRPAPSRTPFVARALPQRAFGDLDGDGRSDVASIQDSGRESHILLGLSGSSTHIELTTAVSALVEGDIDHDGDLDLVAATPAGGVIVWLNDGHGNFTRQPPTHDGGLSAVPSLTSAVEHSGPADLGSSASMDAGRRQRTRLVELRRSPQLEVIRHSLRSFVARSPRAPPVLSVA
jgi:hypothetical protein